MSLCVLYAGGSAISGRGGEQRGDGPVELRPTRAAHVDVSGGQPDEGGHKGARGGAEGVWCATECLRGDRRADHLARISSWLFAAVASEGDYSLSMGLSRPAGQEMVTAVGDEVDRLEDQIRALEPSIKHVDIETN